MTSPTWWTALAPGPADGRLTVLLLPFAGGAAHAFMPWVPHLGAGARLLAARYPGRGERITEPPLRTAAELVELLFREATTRIGGAAAVVGPSLGAVLGFEVAWRLQEAGVPLVAFVASASRAPQVPSAEPAAMHTLADDALADELHRRGDLPAEFLADRELLELVLPVLRADFAIGETYQYGPEPRRLSCPLIAVGGNADPLVPVPALEAWREVADGPFRMELFPGGHFYYRERLAEVGEVVRTALRAGDRIAATEPVGAPSA